MMKRRMMMMKGHILKNFPNKDILNYIVEIYAFAWILFPACSDQSIYMRRIFEISQNK